MTEIWAFQLPFFSSNRLDQIIQDVYCRHHKKFRIVMQSEYFMTDKDPKNWNALVPHQEDFWVIQGRSKVRQF